MRKKIFITCVVLLVFFVVTIFSELTKFSPVLFQLLFHKDIVLKKQDDTLNALLLGTAGGSHDGADLTDTIMFVSLQIEKKKTSLISIPRDLWVPDLNAKINTAYAKGENRKKNGGLLLAKAVVSQILGQRIDYVARVDFDGFVKAIDFADGLDIEVEQSFNDYYYPIEEKTEDLCGQDPQEADLRIATMSSFEVFPCRYQQVGFEKGKQHMNGEQALIFVRSRNATGAEGTDFARSARQQKVIKTFKDKVLSVETLLNPIKIINLYVTLSDSIHTDIKQEEIDDFIRLVKKLENVSVHSYVIDVVDKQKQKDGLLVNPPLEDFNDLWVLIPKAGDGNYSQIHTYVSCVLVSDTCSIPN